MKKVYLLGTLFLTACLTANAQNSVSVDLTSRLLVNPDFEIADTSSVEGVVKLAATNGDYEDHDKAIFSGCYGKVPYGWSVNGSLSGTSRGTGTDAVNYHGNASCWFFQGTFDPGWKLYQTIPASKLTPGLYKVTCLLWVPFAHTGKNNASEPYKTDKYTEKMGACCLFANDNVQYYGMEKDYQGFKEKEDGTYGNNLTSTDKVVTYANYAPGWDNAGFQMLLPMVVYVNVGEGEDLTLGIRTSSIDRDGNTRGNGSGWFKVDDFHVERVLAQPEKSIDEQTSELCVNNGFELDADGNPTTGQQPFNESSNDYYGDDHPYGWYREGACDDGGIHPNFVWMLEGKESAYLSGKSAPLDNFSLYQTVDAEKLTPGIYEVRARVFQEWGKFGQARIYASNGNDTYAQYYARSSEYDQNLNSEEHATFAGHQGNSDSNFSKRSRELHEMWVDCPIESGNELEFGFKTGGMKKDGTMATAFGNAHIDYFRVFRKGNIEVTYNGDADNNVDVKSYKVRVTVNRTFNNGEWTTVCFPFSLNADDVKAVFGNDTKLASFESAAGSTLNFKSASAIEAGVPYIIKPSDALASPIVIDDVDVTTATAQSVKGGDFAFTGSFNPVTVSANDSKYACIGTDGQAAVATADTQVKAFGAVIENTKGANDIKVTVDGNITGINNVNVDEESNVPVYNVAGQRVNDNYRGLQIKNGKKVIKK